MAQLLTESFVLAVVSSLIGMVLAYSTLGAIKALAPPDVGALESH